MKFRYLDGLRGVAAFVVLLDHFAFALFPAAITGQGVARFGEQWVHNTPLYVLVSGDYAVCIFFVLSGIVLSAKFFATGDGAFVVATATKRYLRLAIPVLGSVLLACALVKLGLMFNQPVGAAASSPWWQSFWMFAGSWRQALQEALIGVFSNSLSVYNPPLWTIQMEFWGSFLVFMVLLAFAKLRNRWLIYGLLAVVFAKTYYLAFLLGVAMCDYHYSQPDGWVRRWLARGWWLPVLVGSLVLGSYPVVSTEGTMFAGWHLPGFGYNLQVAAHVAGAFGLIAVLMAVRPLQWVLERRPTQFLGRVSFSLYLLHFLVLGSYASYLFTVLPAGWAYPWRALAVLLPTVVVALSAAYVYARLVDEPAIRFAGWLYARVFTAAGRRVRVALEPSPTLSAADAEPAPVLSEYDAATGRE